MATVNTSLSARRAWIEMVGAVMVLAASEASLSARRAWIEIASDESGSWPGGGRSPQGERG